MVIISFQNTISKNFSELKTGSKKKKRKMVAISITVVNHGICSHGYECVYLTRFSYTASHFDHFNNLVK